MTAKFELTLDTPTYARAELEVPPGGLYIENLNVFVTGVGQAISGIHPENDECQARGCSVHAPSDHSMREMKTLWRGDRGLMERVCEHDGQGGCGHPDPDHMAFLKSLVADGRLTEENYIAEGVHGCDGCCVDPEEWERLLEENRLRNEEMAQRRKEEEERVNALVATDRGELEAELSQMDKRRRDVVQAMGIQDMAALEEATEDPSEVG